MFDYETKDSYTIRVRSTDQGALWFEKQFTITVTDVVETTARIGITIDTGTGVSIFIWDNTDGTWAIDEDTEKPVDGSNHEASAGINVAGGHSYCVWVGGNATYDVGHCPSGWSKSDLEGGGEQACGLAAAGSNNPVHFTQA